MQLDVTIEKDGSITILAKTDPIQGQEAKKEALKKFAPSVNAVGFRPGKAPLNMVEKQIKTDKLAEETISILSSAVYQSAIEQHHLEPITQPLLQLPELKELKPNEDPTPIVWPKVIEQGIEIEIKTFQKPEIELGDWKKLIQKINVTAPKPKPVKATKKTAKPSAKKEISTIDPTNTPETATEDLIIDKLIDGIKFDLPKELIDGEAQHLLMHQIETLKNLGVSYDDYIKSQNKDANDLKNEMTTTAEKTLRTRFILAEIANDAKLGNKSTFKDVLDHLKTYSTDQPQ